jgi:hypothetical protein
MKTTSLTQQVSGRTLLVRALAGLLGAIAALAALPQKAEAGVYIGVGVSVGVPPPPLPVYEQPPIPGPGYIWTPGYWAWDGAEYYWVPGTWVIAPFYGALWTPGYWGWNDGFYVFHRGYWGYHVGFYGGIHYGCGYTGVGYAGGYWGHGGFYYNRSVNRINNVHITHVYDKTVINHVNRVSYNGGRGGVMAHATPQEAALARHSRMGPIAAQQRQMTLASHNPAMRATFNHGDPPIAATQRPGAFNSAGLTPARGIQCAAHEQPCGTRTANGGQQSGPAFGQLRAACEYGGHGERGTSNRPLQECLSAWRRYRCCTCKPSGSADHEHLSGTGNGLPRGTRFSCGARLSPAASIPCARRAAIPCVSPCPRATSVRWRIPRRQRWACAAPRITARVRWSHEKARISGPCQNSTSHMPLRPSALAAHPPAMCGSCATSP